MRVARSPRALVALALLAALLAPAPWGWRAATAAPDVATGSTPADVKAFVEMVAAYDAAVRANDLDRRVMMLPGLCSTAVATTWPESDLEARKAVLAARTRVRVFCQRAIFQPSKALILAGMEGYAILATPGSSQDLKAMARKRDNKRRPLEIRLAALAAWGAIHDPGTHGELLEYVRLPSADAEAKTLAISALMALQGFRGLERGEQRYEVMGEVIALFTRLRDEAGIRTGMTITPVSKDWYETVEKPFVEVVNALGGQIFVSYHQCVRWWEDNKKSIRAGRVWAKPQPLPGRPSTPDSTPR